MLKPDFSRISSYFSNLINLAQDCDADATIRNISDSSEFKGLNVWILVFAIFLASIGLNVNSTAVIIGAMLVSPLMGPIMGVGLAIGINDLNLLKKSLKNLLIMANISLIVSSIYFFFTPLSDAQSELLARTRPTIFDVLIAVFGGFAGIVASSRTEEKTTVVSGVAIATALMPPLCTAGYGLGTGQFSYFWGAFYLFFINSFFIALATFIIVKYLKFPEKEYVDNKRRKNVRHSIAIFSLIVIIPSIFIAYNVVKETAFNSSSIKYIADIEQSADFPDVQIIKSSRDFKEKRIEIAFVGKPLSDEQMQYLQSHLHECNLGDVDLQIKQAGAQTFDLNRQPQLIQDLFDKKDHELARKDSIINDKDQQINHLQTLTKINKSDVAKELQTLYPEIQKFTIGEINQYSGNTIDSIEKQSVMTIYWTKHPSHTTTENLTKWIKIRIQDSTLKIENKILD